MNELVSIEVKRLKEFENPVLIASDENSNSIILAEFMNEEYSEIYGKNDGCYRQKSVSSRI